MEFITEQGEGKANKEQGEKSCIASHNNFIFIDKYIIFQTLPVFNPYARIKPSIRQGQYRPKEPNNYSTMGI